MSTRLHKGFACFTCALGFLAGAWDAHAAAAHADESATTLYLWPNDKESSVPAEQQLPSRGGDIVRVTSVTQPSITLYRAPATATLTPGILICPGGGYKHLAVNIEGSEVAQWLNSIGITAAVLKYTVPENRPSAFQDAQRALRLLRSNAADWKIDASRIGVLGFSAGGHLAARLSTHFGEQVYPPADDADKQSCRPDFTVLIYPAYLANERYELADEVTVTSATPPAFIVQTEDDRKYVASSLGYAIALHNANVPAELHLYSTGGHGYGLRPSSHAVSQWPRLCESWLRHAGILAPATQAKATKGTAEIPTTGAH
ncbi:MAG: alpha/beta hydrolase [Candidatus Sumerlaeaceae bacterium]